ncbi:MAG TPA: hypothetical protein VKB88_46595 [Bryobacteraceae bacterium]|nr:hypothetical protein [Bryobacteraceae bacterium]
MVKTSRPRGNFSGSAPRMTQRCAHLSPKYMAGAVGKLDAVFGEVMPETGSMTLVSSP